MPCGDAVTTRQHAVPEFGGRGPLPASSRNRLSKPRMRRYDAGVMRSQETGVVNTKEDDNDASLVVGIKRGDCPARLSRLGTGKRAANPVRVGAEFPQAAGR